MGIRQTVISIGNSISVHKNASTPVTLTTRDAIKRKDSPVYWPACASRQLTSKQLGWWRDHSQSATAYIVNVNLVELCVCQVANERGGFILGRT